MEKKKTKKKNKKKIVIDIIDILMIGVLILLGIYIIYLGFQIKNKAENDKKEKKANIVIPIIEKNQTAAITISMNEFKENSEYIFKVRNYRNKKIAKQKINYVITIMNKDLTDITINRNNSTNNIAKEEKQFTIENNIFPKNEKSEDIYIIKLKSKKNLKKDSKVSIKVDS